MGTNIWPNFAASMFPYDFIVSNILCLPSIYKRERERQGEKKQVWEEWGFFYLSYLLIHCSQCFGIIKNTHQYTLINWFHFTLWGHSFNEAYCLFRSGLSADKILSMTNVKLLLQACCGVPFFF